MLKKINLKHNLLLILATIFSVVLSGYHFGSFDQAIHIPFVHKFADLSLFPDDKFIDLRFIHYSFFWMPFSFFAKAGILEEAVFIVHMVITYLIFRQLYNLSIVLFDNIKTAYMTIAVFTVPHISFGGFLLTEFSLLNRTFAIPFLLLSIGKYLKKKYLQAFFLLGVMYNFHAVSVNFALAILFFTYIWQTGPKNWKKIILNFLSFLIPALPVIVWKFTGSSETTLLADRQWFETISKGMLENVFYIFSFNPLIMLGTLSGISSFALFFIAKKYMKENKYVKTVTKFMTVIIFVLFVQILSTYFYPSVLIIQSQIIRIGVFAMLFGYLYFVHLLNISSSEKKGRKIDHLFGLSALMFCLSSFFPTVVYLLAQSIKKIRLRRLLILLTITFAITLQTIVLVKYNLWHPGIYIRPLQTDWYKTQLWAEKNTPKDAVFIIPAHMWWFYTTEWRVGSKRSVVTSLSELLEAAFEPDYMPHWKERFDDLSPGTIEKFNGNVFDNIKTTEKNFYSLSAEDFKKTAEKYNARYLVFEKPNKTNLPAVYQNKGFIVYKLPCRCERIK